MNWVLATASAGVGWQARTWAGAGGLAEGMLEGRAGDAGCGGPGARHPGLLALRSASGLGLPGMIAGRPARQRSTEL